MDLRLLIVLSCMFFNEILSAKTAKEGKTNLSKISTKIDNLTTMLETLSGKVGKLDEKMSTLQGACAKSKNESCESCPNPCSNGNYVKTGTTFVCNCQAGWSGTYCEVSSTGRCLDTNALQRIGSLGTNAALRKTVTMSSEWGGSPGSLMVDGERRSTWPCGCTAQSTDPWAVIDLQSSYTLRYIYLLNRGDCCPERLHNLQIWVGNSLSALSLAIDHKPAVGTDCTFAFPANTSGRYVKLQIIGAGEYLTVCEAEVYV